MKRHSPLILLGLLISTAPSAVMAQQSIHSEAVGEIYVSSSPNEYQSWIRGVGFTAPVTLYVDVDIDFGDIGLPDQNATNGLRSWEAHVSFPPGLIVTSSRLLPPGSVDVSGPDAGVYDYVVETGSIVAAGAVQPLAAFDVIALPGTADAVISIGPVSGPSVEGEPSWVVANALSDCPTDESTADCRFAFARTRDFVVNPTTIPADAAIHVGDSRAVCTEGSTTIEIPLVLAEGRGVIDAWGLDVVVPDALTFVSCRPGDLTEDWTQLACNVLAPTRVRIGGFDPQPIVASATGVLAYLTFEVPCSTDGGDATFDICLANPTDDLDSADLSCGTVTCSAPVLGDVSGDFEITAADALCAFMGWLIDGVPPCALESVYPMSADVDCDGDVSPADALCIFRSWLDGSCDFCESSAGPLEREMARSIDLSHEWIDHGEFWEFVVRTPSGASLDAWGLEWAIDPAMGEPVEVDFGAVDPVASGARVENGRLRIGAVTSAATARTSAQVLFRATWAKVEGASTNARLLKGVDDLANATSVASRADDRPGLLRRSEIVASPNPFNPRTSIAVFVAPDVDASNAGVVIVDTRGRLVRSFDVALVAGDWTNVVWNGRDTNGDDVSSGVYFVKLVGVEDATVTKLALVR